MNKGELIESLAAKTGYSKSDIDKILKEFDNVITEGLEKDGRVRLGNLGFLNLSYRGPRTGRNPQKPEETYNKPETVVPTFKPSEQLKASVSTPQIIASVKEKKVR